MSKLFKLLGWATGIAFTIGLSYERVFAEDGLLSFGTKVIVTIIGFFIFKGITKWCFETVGVPKFEGGRTIEVTEPRRPRARIIYIFGVIISFTLSFSFLFYYLEQREIPLSYTWFLLSGGWMLGLMFMLIGIGLEKRKLRKQLKKESEN